MFYIEIDGKIMQKAETFDDVSTIVQICGYEDFEIKETDKNIVQFNLPDSGESIMMFEDDYKTLTVSQEYVSKVRLKEIEHEIEQIENNYREYLDLETVYTNGKTYRIRYAEESYQTLIAAETSLQMLKAGMSEEEAAKISSNFPLKIWDSSKLEENAIDMTFAELVELALFLKNLQQAAWDERKAQIALLEAEKLELMAMLASPTE